MASSNSLAGLIGSYDNLHEPTPLANKPSTILGVTIAFQVVTWICAVLRLWTRFRIMKAPWWDDLFVVFSLSTTTLGTTIIAIGGAHYGLGQHFILLGSTQAMRNYLHGFFIANGSYILSTAFIKLALLLQYLRVFERGTSLHWLCIGLIVFVSLWGFAYNIVAWFPCSPISAYWSLEPNANCWGFASQNPKTFRATFESHSSVNMVLDLVIWIIPIPLYFRPNVQRKTKLGLLGVLFLGGIANLCSIWRLVTIVQSGAATKPTFDPSWYGCISIILAAVEVDMAVVCASVPVFWPVLQAAGFQIFITKEVQVTSETRLKSRDDGDDDVELQYAGAPPAGTGNHVSIGAGRPTSLHSSHDDSEETLHHMGLANSGDSRKHGSVTHSHYEDKFMQAYGRTRSLSGGTKSKSPSSPRQQQHTTKRS